jgi:hypothetical protein
MFRLFWVSIIVGLLFGVGGWLVDSFTGFRRLGGGLSSWALVAGGVVVGLNWHGDFRFGDAATPSPWPSAIQYVAVVLLCWGVMMFFAPRPRREP